MSKISILFVIDGLEYGGGERTFLQLIQHLPQEGFTIYAATNPDGAFAERLHKLGIRVHPFDLSNKFDLSKIGRLRSIIRKHQINIVHSQGARADFFARMAVKKMNKVRLVNTIAMPVDGFDVNPLLKRFYITADRYSERFVDRFIAVSGQLRKTLIEKHHIAAEKVNLIYNGIELGEYDSSPTRNSSTKIREEFGIPGDAFLIAAIGRLVWQKGFKYLIEAARSFTSDNIRVLIVGDGPLRNPLQQLARDHDLEGRVLFSGQRQDIPAILACANAVAIPSLLEGFPMVTLEAMAMQKPIFASRIPGIDEQIIDHQQGLLVPPKNPEALADAIITLVNDRQQGSSLANNARERAEKEFTLDKMILATVKLYQELMAAGKTSWQK